MNLEWIIERTLINVINLFDFDKCVSRKIFAVFSGCIFRHFDLKKKKKKGIVNICFECKLHTFHLNFEENGSVYRLLDSDSR